MSTDASPDYTIRARIVADDASSAGADSASRRLREVENQATRSGLSMSGMFTRAFALIGGATGIGFAIRGMVGLNSEIQTSRNGLATLFNALSGMPIARSIGLARSEMKALQQDAARGVGEFSDYSQAYQMLLSPGLGAGKNLGQIRELVRNSLAAGSAMRGQEGLRLMPMDLVQAMSGQVGMRTTPMVAQALAAANISLEKFRAMKPAEQFDALNTAFGKFAPGVALMGRSWDAQFSTLRDNTKQLIRDVTGPLFDKWTTDLIKVNDWMAANRDTIAEIATEWGGKLVRMWDVLISRASIYAGIVAGAAVAPSLSVGATSASGILASLRSGMLTGALAGSMRAGAVGPGFAGVGAVLGGGAGGLGALAGILGALAGPAALVGAAFASVLTAIRNGGPGLTMLENGIYRVSQAFRAVGNVLDMVTGSGGALDTVGQALLGTLGGLLYVVDPLVRVIGSLGVGLGLVLNIVTDGFRAMYLAATGDVAGAAKISVSKRFREAGDTLGKVWSNGPDFTGKEPPGADGDVLGGLKVPKHITNIGTLNLNVKTEINADPDRVMMAMGEGLDKLRVYAKQGRRLPALGV